MVDRQDEELEEVRARIERIRLQMIDARIPLPEQVDRSESVLQVAIRLGIIDAKTQAYRRT